MQPTGPRFLSVCGALALLVWCAAPARAQSSRLIQSMDVNKDGKVSRDEMPEGSATRRMFDNIVRDKKLEANKTYTIQELEQVMGLGPSSSAGSSNSASRAGSPRRGTGLSRSGGPATRAPTDGRPFRPLQELPEPYRSYDKDGDGQIGLYEWPRDRIREFITLDVNDDGFLTINELKASPSSGAQASREKKEETKSPSADQGTP